jgi:protein-S-isoprenylcysteine O-methyltransferase Ste14
MSLPFSDQTLLLSGSIALVWLSRKALGKPKSHGYYRFIAVEFILLLMVLNRQPTGDQTLAEILLLLSAALVILGYGALLRFGNADASRIDDSLFSFEKTTTLVTGNIFRYIRHPMYSSLMALAWGFFFRDPSLLALSLAGLASLFLFLTARADERECLVYFGDRYVEYMKRTRRFVPFLF